MVGPAEGEPRIRLELERRFRKPPPVQIRLSRGMGTLRAAAGHFRKLPGKTLHSRDILVNAAGRAGLRCAGGPMVWSSTRWGARSRRERRPQTELDVALLDDRPHARPTRKIAGRLSLALGLAVLSIPTIAAGAPSVSRQAEAVRQLESEIAGLDARYGQAATAYSAASTRLTTVKNRITANTAALKDAKTEFDNARSDLAARLSAAYRQPQPSGLELLLRSTSLSEAISRVDFMKRAQRQDADLIAEIAAARVRMEKARTQLLADQKAAKAEERETANQLTQVRSIRSARRGALIAARGQLATMIAAAQRANDARRVARLRATQRGITTRIGQNQPNAPAPTAPPPPEAPTGGGNASAILQKIALCESGGNPAAVSSSGLYRGKYQFDPQTWKAYGGSGDDPAAASEAEQDAVAARLYAARGTAPWPICGR